MSGKGGKSGIDQLLAAEEKAAVIVKAARAKRAEHLRKAKEEAQKRIQELRMAKEKELENMRAKFSANDTSAQELEKQTDIEIEEIVQKFNENKAEVIQMLLDKVAEVSTAVPATYKNSIVQTN